MSDIYESLKNLTGLSRRAAALMGQLQRYNDALMQCGFYNWLTEQNKRSDTVGWVVRLLLDTGDESPLLGQLKDARGVDDVFSIISALERGKIKSSLNQAYEEYFASGI